MCKKCVSKDMETAQLRKNFDTLLWLVKDIQASNRLLIDQRDEMQQEVLRLKEKYVYPYNIEKSKHVNSGVSHLKICR